MRYASVIAWTQAVTLMSLCSMAPGAAGTPSSGPQKPPALTVHIKDYKFQPQTATIAVGDTVEFVNDDDDTHTATALDGTFDSNGLSEKGRFTYTFAKPGTYSYHCKIHTNMKGTIVVQPTGKDAQ